MTTPLYLKLHYNKRQQLVDLRLGSVNDEWNWNRGLQTFYYGTDAITNWNPFADDDDNNGNVRRALHYVPTAVNGSGDVTAYVIPQLHDYSYDSLNRISGMLEWQLDGSGNWQSNVVTQNYGYDRFGNRGITSATGGVNSYNPSYTASTNRISSDLSYDSAGNITYDAENHMVTASSGGTYVYDGEGRRVKRTASSQEWWYVYGVGGELIAEYLSTATTTVKKEYGYRGGQLLVLWDADKSGDERLKWLVTDHLGSTRMEADKSGSLSAIVRHDYLPFGEELTAGIRGSGYGYVSTNVRQKFTGYERDGETGLDFAQARYCASIQGRFTSPDPLMASGRAKNPQSWNRYSYVLNRPLSLIDPSGMLDDEVRDENETEKREKVTSYQVVVQERGGGKIVQEATITVQETQVEYVDNTGTVSGTDPVSIWATAKNTGDAPVQYTQDQLNTMANIAQNIAEVSKDKHFDPAIALGLARTETHMGMLQSSEASPAKQSDVNPMQLSSTSGIKPTTDLRSNISGAIDVYNRGATGNLNADLQTYNGQKNKAAYARTAEGHIDQIRSSTRHDTFRIVQGHRIRD